MAESLELTFRWLKRCKAAPIQPHQHLFGIIQGGMELELRSRAVRQVTSLDLPGYAIGGVSVGEGHEAMVRVVRHTAPLMPDDQVRYLMGVGLPEDLVAAVECGMDIFDCIIPTRYAREGTVFTWDGKMSDFRTRRSAKIVIQSTPPANVPPVPVASAARTCGICCLPMNRCMALCQRYTICTSIRT